MSGDVVIVADSVACLPGELVAKYGIEVVPVQVIFGDKIYRDGVDISPSQFYAMLRQSERLPTTAASLPAAFLEAYRRASQRASNILCITLSARFSGMFSAALLAMNMAKESFPDVMIKVMDSGTAAAAEGFVVLAAARTAALGKNMEEVVEAAANVMPRVHLLAMLDTLYYLVKGGRAPRLAAWAGSLLDIKPIVTVKDGEARPVMNPRTTRGALNYILKLMEGRIVKGLPLHVAVMHADAVKQALELRDEISSRFDCAELFITEFTPVMGAHTGPGLVAVAFYCGN